MQLCVQAAGLRGRTLCRNTGQRAVYQAGVCLPELPCFLVASGGAHTSHGSPKRRSYGGDRINSSLCYPYPLQLEGAQHVDCRGV